MKLKNAVEHPNHPGFYFIPDHPHGLISKEGQVMSTLLTLNSILINGLLLGVIPLQEST